ncbi:MAG: UDP-N-acetylmuramate:L-alanyl-gamma-D-glutamyl-meso-diaminopimelate ligase [Rhodocyclaceae bacterium]|nr:UDP-N-acetylmuramate:L-alanyl-gamma-D-glutamyl-meso-diaminopimelate ligase [Rhodocyclaceae bacterium]
MHIHILGICGTFMGGIAAIARQAGHTVTGCDANVYPPMSTQLAQLGISLTEGWDPAQLEPQADMYVVGNVVSRGNPLMEAILDRGLPYVSGPQWLAETVLRDKWVLAVAGTHGKTTTTSMLTWILEDAGLEPGFLIGGVPENFGVSARLTASPFFVIEADEYDTAFFDKRSKFVHYRPRTAILNNLEFDHADIFADLGAIQTQFHHLVRTVPGRGLLVVNGRDPHLDETLAKGCWTPVERFGAEGGWECAAGDAGAGDPANAHRPDRAAAGLGLAGAEGEDDPAWTVRFAGRDIAPLRWDLLGAHNRMNALAAIAAARHAGVAPAVAVDALARFRNVKRRLEVRGTVRGVTVVDDFAHHPTAITETLAALRERVGRGRVLAVLEPRSNTMKQGVWKGQLAASLADADAVFCYTKGLGWDATGALAPLGARLTAGDDLAALVAAIAAEARDGDTVLVMSNGGFEGIHGKLLDALAG